MTRAPAAAAPRPCSHFAASRSREPSGTRVGRTPRPARLAGPTEPLLRSVPAGSWISTAQLTADTLDLLPHLPLDLVAIAGVPRSGLLPATILATALHLPLYEWTAASGLRKLGCGSRMKDHDQQRPGPLLIVDDSVAGARSQTRITQWASKRQWSGPILRAALYVNPDWAHTLDFAAVFAPMPHYFEWNFFNSGYAALAGYDFDGVLCEDCPDEADDGGERYRAWMERVRPLHLPRRFQVPLIVTMRPEWTRDLTLAWLARHGVSVRELVMSPWQTLADRRRLGDPAEYKARAFGARKLDYFVESSPTQASRLCHWLSQCHPGRTVICPTSGEVWQT